MCGAVTAPVLCLPVCQGPSLKAPRVTCGDPVPEKNRRRLDNVFSSQIEGAPDHRSHSSQAQLGKSVSLSGFPAWSMETQNNWGTVRKSRPPAPPPTMGDSSHKLQGCSSLLDVQVFARWGVSSGGQLLFV